MHAFEKVLTTLENETNLGSIAPFVKEHRSSKDESQSKLLCSPYYKARYTATPVVCWWAGARDKDAIRDANGNTQDARDFAERG